MEARAHTANESNGRSATSGFYEVRISGHLDHLWAGWFEGFAITLEESGSTLLSGQVVDQAALYGLLRKVRDCGLSLVSVNQVAVDSEQVDSEQ